jgi:hypothetical protein
MLGGKVLQDGVLASRLLQKWLFSPGSKIGWHGSGYELGSATQRLRRQPHQHNESPTGPSHFLRGVGVVWVWCGCGACVCLSQGAGGGGVSPVWFVFLLAAVRAQAGGGLHFSLGAARALFGARDCVLGMGASSKEDKLDGTLECKVHETHRPGPATAILPQ